MPTSTKKATPAAENGIDPFSRVWGEMRSGKFDAFHWGALCRQQNPARYFSEVHARLLMTYVSRLQRRAELGLAPPTEKVWCYGRDIDYSPQGFSVMPLYQRIPPLVYVGIGGEPNGPFLPLRSRYSYGHHALLKALFGQEPDFQRGGIPQITYYSFLQKQQSLGRSVPAESWPSRQYVPPQLTNLYLDTATIDAASKRFLRHKLGDPLDAFPKTHAEAEEHARKLLDVWLRHAKATA